MDEKQIKNIKEKLDRPIVLVGMMGSGKSHTGKMLAKALGVKFFDSDHEIERRAGCSIAEIFERDGEPKFREVEKKVVGHLLDKGVSVIATGGGAVTNADTAKAIQEKSISIWLNADIPTLMERLKNKKDRPLLACGGPHEILEELLAKRRHIYEKADIIVDGGNAQVDQTLQDVLQALYKFLCKG